jgi:hypothetical protein
MFFGKNISKILTLVRDKKSQYLRVRNPWLRRRLVECFYEVEKNGFFSRNAQGYFGRCKF